MVLNVVKKELIIVYCFLCGAKVNLKEILNSVKIGICETCEHEISVKDHGKVESAEIEKAQQEFQKESQRNINNKPDRNNPIRSNPVRRTLHKMIRKQINTSGKIKMYDPEWDRNIEAPGTIRARDNNYAKKKKKR